MREHRQLRAHDDEWAIIKDFMHIVRKIGAEEAAKILADLKQKYN